MIAFEARCSTTAMGIMPHRNVEQALRLALSLDIPFWPQLPKVSMYEDMYVQTSQNFPGIAIDFDKERLKFDTSRFDQELDAYFVKMDVPETFALTAQYSAVFHKFLSGELQGYKAIRGQVTGPVSFGFKVLDENLKPIIYNDEVRTVLFDFVQKKANIQYRALKERNPNAFVWLDEPGLGYVFSGLSGYNEQQANEHYHDFVEGLEGPKGLHLCAEVNLPYLLELGVEILSFDAYQIGFMPKEYAGNVAEFIKKGGIISWGIVPTESTVLATQTPKTLAATLSGYWEVVSQNTDLSLSQIAMQALVAPARCCLSDVGQSSTVDKKEGKCQVSSSEEEIVEKAFAFLPELSQMLRDKYGV
ncbi:MAG: hypothetical protein OEV52_01390 [Dehalococcoidia bacterium]|nr:hypothetical protein [Dehalococcoidia bacterium]MDH4291455.1 hypothetical protein [Dehalococcoidia bacterium]